MLNLRVVLFFVAAGSAVAGPVVLFSDLGGNAQTFAISIGGSGSASQVIADQFTPSQTAAFADVQVLVESITSNQVSVFLETDSGGLPGTVLEEIGLTGLSQPAGLKTASSVLHPELFAGTPYWLVLVQPNTGTSAVWLTNAAGVLTTATDEVANGVGGSTGPWNALGANQPFQAFEIDGTTPEPSSMVLAALGLVLFGAVGKRITRGPAPFRKL